MVALVVTMSDGCSGGRNRCSVSYSAFTHCLPSLRAHGQIATGLSRSFANTFEGCLPSNKPQTRPVYTGVLSIPLGLSREKIWRQKIFYAWYKLKLICALYFQFVPICTKQRKNFSRQFFPRDKPSGIDNNVLQEK